MRLKKGDLAVLLLLIAAIAGWLGVNKYSSMSSDRQVVIETNGDMYKSIAIKPGMEQKKLHIELENGNHIDIVVDENGAYVSDVVCPDKICQKTGVVSKVGQSIVCLPNKVSVYIEGEGKSEVDNVSY
ncbi:MAG: NusG domain II-containing protein [Pseudomonadota bacterium]